jgi:hypothetical protein
MRFYHRLIALLLLALSFNGEAVKFKSQKEPIIKEFIFGDTKIIKTYQFTKDAPLGDHQIFIYFKGDLQASYRGLSFEFIVPDKNNSTFVALSNSSIPPVAAIVFTSNGHLNNLIYHRNLRHTYCNRTMTNLQWTDKSDPEIEFTYKILGNIEYIEDITFLNCDGDRVILK